MMRGEENYGINGMSTDKFQAGTFLRVLSLADIKTLVIFEPILHVSRSGIWLSQDRKLVLTRTRVNDLLDYVQLPYEKSNFSFV